MMRYRLAAWVAASFMTIAQPAAAAERPNFLIIVADDLGYSDLGAFGGEIRTPNLDALAGSGVQLSRFYAAPTCSPTRAMMLTGVDNHVAGLGVMNGFAAPNQKGRPGYEGHISDEVVTLPEVLSANGYATLLSGKWHLGEEAAQDPKARGFERSFTMLTGEANHFGKDVADYADWRSNPQKYAGKGLPHGLYSEDGEIISSLPDGFYSSDAYAGWLIARLDEARAGGADRKPFFALLSFTAPHWPLQAPAEDIARYRGRYDAGFEALRRERLRRQVELGLIDPKVAAHPPELPRSWGELSAEERKVASRNMEVYAAMVDRLDQNVGRVIAALRRSGELENTIIIFLADNGAEATDLEVQDYPMIRERVARADNRLDNRGAADSFISYGPGWAQAATAPSWLYKTRATEGGIHVPAIVAGPGVERRGLGGSVATVMDIAPTVLELAGVAPPAQFKGRSVPPIQGKSLVRYLSNAQDRAHQPGEEIGFEMFGSRAVRRGDWKLTDPGDGKWRLFNLASDPGETTDLSQEEPARLRDMHGAWEAYARRSNVIMRNAPLY